MGGPATVEHPLPTGSPAAGIADTEPRRRGALGRGWTRAAGFGVVALALAGAALASIAVGSLSIPVEEVVRAFIAFDNSDEHVVVRELRGPRTLVAIAVGASLGVAGAVMQGMTRNPLADPGILGIEAGAALAVVCAIFLLGVSTVTGHVWFALGGAAIAGTVVYALGTAGRSGGTPVTLALAGAALAALLSAITSAIIVLDAQTLDEFRFWVVGSVAGRGLDVLTGALSFLAVGLVLGLASGRALNALSLGDDVARSLGQRVAWAKARAAAGVVLLAGGAVAVAGPVGFIGLTVPHVARAIVGPDYRWLLPYSALLGAILILVADVVGRVVARPAEVQVGIVMALIGAPVFIALVRRRRMAEL
ncbi:MAG: iron ABC transporter permease [Solirubrobacteraceae bacterium MAG38_C4-C5]|nr:iron ABC transporter permease [Candidatus Siliceabacter maunaloa]